MYAAAPAHLRGSPECHQIVTISRDIGDPPRILQGERYERPSLRRLCGHCRRHSAIRRCRPSPRLADALLLGAGGMVPPDG
ncbi:MAG: hypothetical protein C6Y20_15050, partial [Tagaea sp. CACIAM 22H2]|nr:hypothetical protein [Tagaea sp. CACIAM 22H2]